MFVDHKGWFGRQNQISDRHTLNGDLPNLAREITDDSGWSPLDHKPLGRLIKVRANNIETAIRQTGIPPPDLNQVPVPAHHVGMCRIASSAQFSFDRSNVLIDSGSGTSSGVQPK